ncbi:MAG: LytR/AlgR family response regulator transcription factor [Adhaeribacter sp.]
MRNSIKCLIVEDEPIAQEIIRTYCHHLPHLEVLAACSNALEAKAFLQTHPVDILFLDINMPVLDGLAFLRTLRRPPQVIFTTAYKEYALEAFDLSACDYLLKPFSLERFIVAVDKALDRLPGTPNLVRNGAESESQDHIFIKAEGRIYKIFYQDLLFAEAQGNYTRVVTGQNILLASMAFTSFTELLPESLFVRVHRSYILNKAKITHIEGNRVFIDKQEIPIGGNYKEAFYRKLGL